MSTFYKRKIPEIGLSLERDTNNVPNDGRFYIVRDGELVDSYPSERRALTRFRELVEKSGFKPKAIDPEEKKRAVIEDRRDQYFRAKDLYWSESHRYKEKGGRGR